MYKADMGEMSTSAHPSVTAVTLQHGALPVLLLSVLCSAGLCVSMCSWTVQQVLAGDIGDRSNSTEITKTDDRFVGTAASGETESHASGSTDSTAEATGRHHSKAEPDDETEADITSHSEVSGNATTADRSHAAAWTGAAIPSVCLAPVSIVLMHVLVSSWGTSSCCARSSPGGATA
jgi:hypothetical protein